MLRRVEALEHHARCPRETSRPSSKRSAATGRRFGELEHDLRNIYGSDQAFCLEALNHYTRADGEAVTLRAVAFTDRNDDGLVTSVRFYTDTSPLFSEA